MGIFNIICIYWCCFWSTDIPHDLCVEAHTYTHKAHIHCNTVTHAKHAHAHKQWHPHTQWHMHAHTHTHTHTHTHKVTHTHTKSHTHTCTHTHWHTHTLTHTHTHKVQTFFFSLPGQGRAQQCQRFPAACRTFQQTVLSSFNAFDDLPTMKQFLEYSSPFRHSTNFSGNFHTLSKVFSICLQIQNATWTIYILFCGSIPNPVWSRTKAFTNQTKHSGLICLTCLELSQSKLKIISGRELCQHGNSTNLWYSMIRKGLK